MLRKLIRFFSTHLVKRPRRPSLSRPTHARVEKQHQAGPTVLKGRCFVIDGDTIVMAKQHIRLFGIDAPEMDQPYGRKAKSAMIALCRGQIITAEILPETTYDRVVAKCLLPDGTDLSAALTEQGLALDWTKFSGGAYRHLEPDGIRKKLWRVAAKHEGRYFERRNTE